MLRSDSEHSSDLEPEACIAYHTGGGGGGGGGGAAGGEPSRLQLLGGGLEHLNVQGLQGLPLIDEALNECATPAAPHAGAAGGGEGGAWGLFLGSVEEDTRACGKRVIVT